MGYLTNFIVYTLAMVGVIVLALFVFKTATTGGNKGASSKSLKVHDSLSLGPRKTLYIVSAGEEKFLIAGDADKTTLVSKLGVQEKAPVQTKELPVESFKDTMANLPARNSYMDKSVVGIYKTQNKPYDSVMKNLAERIKG